jgi:hypothetical protein
MPDSESPTFWECVRCKTRAMVMPLDPEDSLEKLGWKILSSPKDGDGNAICPICLEGSRKIEGSRKNGRPSDA